jgi:uncharacterized protein (DUF2344 family)
MRYHKIENREYNWNRMSFRPYSFTFKMDYSVGCNTDTLIFDLHNTRRLEAVRVHGRTPDILSRDMRFKYYVDRMQENCVEIPMALPDSYPWQIKHDSIKRVEQLLDWIKTNVKCKWSLRIGRMVKQDKLFVKFSFEDVPTAVMFRLLF